VTTIIGAQYPSAAINEGPPRNMLHVVISGAHVILYSRDADADRTFLRDVLGFPHVDAGDGWLIFALPPTELAVHPTDGEDARELYLLCDDVEAMVGDLEAKGVAFTGPVVDRGWGRVTAVRLPGGGEIGLYEPRHPVAHG
jgi:catechol 2,3-dioxygenase-like lactoylglutathione lyase family enzyme